MAQKEKKNAAKDTSDSEIVNKFKQNPAAFIGTVVVLVLVIVSFVLVPAIVPERLGSGADFVFGYYDRVPISYVPGNMFAQYREQIDRYYRSQGADVSNFRVQADMWRQAYEAALTHIAILQIMKKSNYTPPERTVNRNVAQRPEFQENGRFSNALFQQMSESQRLVIWRQTREELEKVMFFNDFFSMPVSSGEANFIANMATPTRRFEMVIFNVDDYPESGYLSFATENSDLFNSIHLSKITVSGEREAKKILASIKDGTSTFEDAARAQSQDSYADKGGDMGIRYFVELTGEITNPADRDIICNLGRGELSDVVRAGENWAFFRIEDEKTTADFTDAAVMERVRSHVKSVERGRMEDRAISEAENFISEAKEIGVENAAAYRYLSRHTFGPLPINYGGVDIFTALESYEDSLSASGLTKQDIEGLSRNEEFWKTAFAAPLNTPSKPLVQGSRVLVFIPIQQLDAEESSIESIASMYSSYWLNNITEQSLPSYFMNSERDESFWAAFFRYIMP